MYQLSKGGNIFDHSFENSFCLYLFHHLLGPVLTVLSPLLGFSFVHFFIFLTAYFC